MTKRRTITFLTLLLLSIIAGCDETRTVRIAPDQVSDVEQGLGMTSQDFRSISERMARSLVSVEQIQNASVPPKIAFISFQNNSESYIDGDKFLNRMRTELIKHCQGKVVFLDRSMIKDIEKENRDKLSGTRTSLPKEVTPYGADFFLTGMVDSIKNVAGREETVYRRYSFRLTDATSSGIVWEDDYEIKRYRHRGIVNE